MFDVQFNMVYKHMMMMWNILDLQPNLIVCGVDGRASNCNCQVDQWWDNYRELIAPPLD